MPAARRSIGCAWITRARSASTGTIRVMESDSFRSCRKEIIGLLQLRGLGVWEGRHVGDYAARDVRAIALGFEFRGAVGLHLIPFAVKPGRELRFSRYHPL